MSAIVADMRLITAPTDPLGARIDPLEAQINPLEARISPLEIRIDPLELGTGTDAELSRAARASHFSFGKSDQNHLRRTLTGTMKLSRYPVLLSKSGPARTRTSMCSNMRALLPLLLPVLGSLYGAKSNSKAASARAKGGSRFANPPDLLHKKWTR